MAQRIVGGRLAGDLWEAMEHREDGADIVSELLEEILNEAAHRVVELQLKREAPMVAAREALAAAMCVIDVEFLTLDPGEAPNDSSTCSWAEDEEPLPSDIDVWARGAISLSTRTDRRAKSPLVAPAADDQIMSALEFKSREDDVILFEPESEDSESELEEQSTASVVETTTTIIRQPLLTRRANCKDSVSDELEKPTEEPQGRKPQQRCESLAQRRAHHRELAEIARASRATTYREGDTFQGSGTYTHDSHGRVLAVVSVDARRLPQARETQPHVRITHTSTLSSNAKSTTATTVNVLPPIKNVVKVTKDRTTLAHLLSETDKPLFEALPSKR